MVSSKDDDRDDEWFKEIYGKEYTGPTKRGEHDKDPKKRTSSSRNKSAGESDEEEPAPDPNAVPTDFTSREAKVWEAKAKAIERNWKRRKEEELTCRICGETGHFTQGCPSTIGGGRKSREVVETIPVRDKRLKSRLLGGSVIENLEKDTGCRLRFEDSHSSGSVAFTIRITGPDKIAVNKAVRSVNNYLNQLDDDSKIESSRGSQGSYGSPPVNALTAAQMQHIERLQQNSSLFPLPGQSDLGNPSDSRLGKERYVSHLDNHQILGGGSPRALNGSGTAYSILNLMQGRDASAAAGNLSFLNGKGYGLSVEERGPHPYDQVQERRMLPGQLDFLLGQEKKQELETRYDALRFPQTLEELERTFLYETRQVTQDQDVEEDKERARHHERMREIHEYYQQILSSLRSKQAQRRDEFLQNDQLRRQQLQHPLGYGHHLASLHSYGGSSLEQRIRSDLLYSGGSDLAQVADRHQEFSGSAYGMKVGSSQQYAKSPAYDNSSHPRDDPPRYPPYR